MATAPPPMASAPVAAAPVAATSDAMTSRELIFEMLEDPRSTKAAKSLAITMAAAILLSTACVVFETEVCVTSGDATPGSNSSALDESCMLGVLPFDALPESAKCQYLFEKARALALQGRQAHAEQNFLQALVILDRTPRPNPQHKALILVGLAAALVEQKKLYMAAQQLCSAVQLTPLLRWNVVESIMRTIARYFKALGSKQRFAQALRTMLDIIQAERK